MASMTVLPAKASLSGRTSMVPRSTSKKRMRQRSSVSCFIPTIWPGIAELTKTTSPWTRTLPIRLTRRVCPFG